MVITTTQQSSMRCNVIHAVLSLNHPQDWSIDAINLSNRFGSHFFVVL